MDTFDKVMGIAFVLFVGIALIALGVRLKEVKKRLEAIEQSQAIEGRRRGFSEISVLQGQDGKKSR